MTDLPEYYFRVRDNGAIVFRLEGEGRQRRLDMSQIAAVNLRTGEVKARGERVLSEADHAAIAAWVEERRAVLAARETDDMRRLVDALNAAAQWAQTRADDATLEAVTEPLLMAMHDLRAVLARKQADRIARSRPDPEAK